MSDNTLRELCNVFRETAMTVWKSGNDSTIKMDLPYKFTDGYPAMIKASMMPDGKVRISDDGLIALHEPLTPTEIRIVCRKQALDYIMRDESDDLPIDCEIYKAVDKKYFCDAVWDIIYAIVDARDIAMMD